MKVDEHKVEDIELYHLDNVDKLVTINRAAWHPYKTVKYIVCFQAQNMHRNDILI